MVHVYVGIIFLYVKGWMYLVGIYTTLVDLTSYIHVHLYT